MIAPYGFAAPAAIAFGAGVSRQALTAAPSFGARALVVTGATPARAAWLADGLRAAGVAVEIVSIAHEPLVEDAMAAVAAARRFRADIVIGIGGGAALDLAKAVAGLAMEPGDPMQHLEVVGQGLPLTVAPLPLIAIPTTAGTGAEATRNAVLGVPAQGRKVSLRDARLLPRLALVDPELTHGLPLAVTLATGLDALTQVIEPYVSSKATAMTDALCRDAIARALAALPRLIAALAAGAEDRGARADMAHVSLMGGISLANAGLGAVHGLAGVLGGTAGGAHGAICGALLGPILATNRAALAARGPELPGAARVAEVCAMIGAAFDCDAADAPAALAAWAHGAGLPGLGALGHDPADSGSVAAASAASSSMKGNPLPLTEAELIAAMAAAGQGAAR
ncbi:MAG: alcohol dehydrogenase class IV [Paracoccaceae bacterium]|jgi:alcohol dehydrogenase class IV